MDNGKDKTTGTRLAKPPGDCPRSLWLHSWTAAPCVVLTGGLLGIGMFSSPIPSCMVKFTYKRSQEVLEGPELLDTFSDGLE